MTLTIFSYHLSCYFILVILANFVTLGFYIQLEEGDVVAIYKNPRNTPERCMKMKNFLTHRTPKILPMSLVSEAIRIIPAIADSLTVYQAASDSLNYVKCMFGSCEEEQSPTNGTLEVREPMNLITTVETAPPSDDQLSPPHTPPPISSASAPVPATFIETRRIFVQNLFFNINDHRSINLVPKIQEKTGVTNSSTTIPIVLQPNHNDLDPSSLRTIKP